MVVTLTALEEAPKVVAPLLLEVEVEEILPVEVILILMEEGNLELVEKEVELKSQVVEEEEMKSQEEEQEVNQK